MLRPFNTEIMLMRKKGLSGPFLSKHANHKYTLSKSVGNYIEAGGQTLPWPTTATFIAAFRGLDDTQNIGSDGDICNLMPLGTTTATSLHSAPIMALDYEGVYREYGIDEPVWKGGRKDGAITYTTDIDKTDLSPHPFLQTNMATTNLMTYSNDALNLISADVNVVRNLVGIDGVANTGSTIKTTVGNFDLLRNNFTVVATDLPSVAIAYIDKSASTSIHSLMAYDTPTVSLGFNPQTGDVISFNGLGTYHIEDRDRYFIIMLQSDLLQKGTPSVQIYPNRDGIIGATIGVLQMEIHENKTINSLLGKPPIFTTDAAASIPETIYTFPSANIDPANADISLEIESLTDGPILAIGNLRLGYGASNLATLDMPLTDNLDFVTGVGPATFVRGSDAIYIDRHDGLLKTATIHVARFEEEGFLSEGASTNLLINSNDFINWPSNTDIEVLPDTELSPEGIQNATKINGTSGNTSHKATIVQSWIIDEERRFSVYLKKGELTQARLDAYHASGVADDAYFDLELGTVITDSSFNNGAKIESLSNDWYRCSVSYKNTADSSSNLSIRIAVNGSSSYDSDIHPGGILMYGAQLENLPFASSYIPTTTAAVSRAADKLSIPPENGITANKDLTISVEANVLGRVDTPQTLYTTFADGIANSRVLSFYRYTSGAEFRTYVGSTFFIADKDFDDGTPFKHLVTIKEGLAEIWINGVKEGEAQAANLIDEPLTDFTIGRWSHDWLFGHIKNLKIWPYPKVKVPDVPEGLYLTDGVNDITASDSTNISIKLTADTMSLNGTTGPYVPVPQDLITLHSNAWLLEAEE